jgi:monothiol glutaredoxin
MSAHERIDELVRQSPVVLFMKGSRTSPQCGFSASAVDILDDYLASYQTVDVLADPELRQGIKEYGNWPTIPQLYVGGSLVGGSDILREMNDSGELERVLGKGPLDAPSPVVHLTDAATRAFQELHEGAGAPVVCLKIGRDFAYDLAFADHRSDGDVQLEHGPVTLVMDRATARRADGLTIDFVERAGGAGFHMDNPNEPKVVQLEPRTLKEWMDEGAPFVLFDVRSEEERATAKLPGSQAFDEAGQALLARIDPATRVVFHCHHGVRSQAAAEHCLRLGFREVYNLSGGIDAWSLDVDPGVARY